MTQLEEIKSQIETLSLNELKDLQNWFAEKDWQSWDEQIKTDIAAGKLDFLLDEAIAAKNNNDLRDL